MLGHNPFYHTHIKKYIMLFGTLFNDISIVRESKAGAKKEVNCAIIYSTKSKQLERLLENPKLQNQWESEFPRLSFEMTGINYAPYRKENTLHYTVKEKETGESKIMHYSPAPYDLNFQLVSYTYYQEDTFQIVEQILPFFQPEYCVKWREIPALDLNRDIHVVLNGLEMDLDNSGDYMEPVKVYTATFNFTLKGFIYGPAEDKPIITNTELKLWRMPTNALMEPQAIYTAEGDPETREIIKEGWIEP